MKELLMKSYLDLKNKGDKITVSAICHAIPIARSSFYQEFDSIESLEGEIIDGMLEELNRVIEAKTTPRDNYVKFCLAIAEIVNGRECLFDDTLLYTRCQEHSKCYRDNLCFYLRMEWKNPETAVFFNEMLLFTVKHWFKCRDHKMDLICLEIWKKFRRSYP